MVKHFLRLSDHTREDLESLIEEGVAGKKDPTRFADRLRGKTLLMIFEKPSLRTRLSFEVGMTQMGGHAIFYSVKDSPLGKKETIADTARVASRMVDLVMARLNHHTDLAEFAEHASVPVINAMSDIAHPCQILSDLMTLRERWGRLDPGRKLAYFGDCCNNVTYSLMIGGLIFGFEVAVACPVGEEFEPEAWVLDEARSLAKSHGGSLRVTHDAREAAREADVLYTDSWMSYHIPKEKEPERIRALIPYQVNAEILALAKKAAVFMNCLPAWRGHEQTAEVIDGPRSIVFEQAENRLHAQKALMAWLAGSRNQVSA